MAELFKIVRGNTFPLKIYVDKMAYDSTGKLSPQAINLNTVGSLQVYAFSYNKTVLLPFTISSDGSYLTATIYNNRRFKGGSWGIKVTGTYNNLIIAATEHRVFKIVACNALSYIPYGIVEGESSYMYNLRFSSGDADDGDTPTPSGQNGWIGFKSFTPPTTIDTNGLTAVDNVYGTRTWVNNVNNARFVVVTPVRNIVFTIGGLPAVLNSFTQGSNIVYYSDELQAVPFTVKISNS